MAGWVSSGWASAEAAGGLGGTDHWSSFAPVFSFSRLTAGADGAASGFESNRGYPAPLHKCALAWHGPTSIHRRSWIFMESLCWRGVPPAPGRLFI